jgi:PPK2 family polyphosphate:nucleotide phosphotransferase
MGEFERYCVKPGSGFQLKDIDPDEIHDWKGKKDDAKERQLALRTELVELQARMYAESKQKLLVVLQAMDTGGKDGTLSAVFDGVNPQGVQVASFKVPTPLEQAHDYLWRIHPNVPGKGEIVVFNRSHYEEVLVVRVHEWATMETTRKRYQQIKDFERMLSEEGVTILKFFLHISKDEQKQRLLDRIDTPAKSWKFNPGDLDERKLWSKYMQAYEDAVRETSTAYAPWYVVPANRNWYRDLIVTSTIVETLKGLKMEYPNPKIDLAPFRQQLMAETE